MRPPLKKVMMKCHEYLQKLGQIDDHLGRAVRYIWGQANQLFVAVDDPDTSLPYPQSGVIRNASCQGVSSMGAWTLAQWSGVVRTEQPDGVDERIYLEYLLERGIPLIREHGD